MYLRGLNGESAVKCVFTPHCCCNRWSESKQCSSPRCFATGCHVLSHHHGDSIQGEGMFTHCFTYLLLWRGEMPLTLFLMWWNSKNVPTGFRLLTYWFIAKIVMFHIYCVKMILSGCKLWLTFCWQQQHPPWVKSMRCRLALVHQKIFFQVPPILTESQKSTAVLDFYSTFTIGIWELKIKEIQK